MVRTASRDSLYGNRGELGGLGTGAAVGGGGGLQDQYFPQMQQTQVQQQQPMHAPPSSRGTSSPSGTPRGGTGADLTGTTPVLINPRHRRVASTGSVAETVSSGHSDDSHTVRSGFYLSPAPMMPRRWTKGDNLGAGSFGCVFLGLNSDTGELFAVKEVAMNRKDAASQQESIEQLEQEVQLLSRLQHPNIVRYIGTDRDASSLYIFLEYVPGGSIASLLRRFGRFEESVICVYTRQILIGLDYLHAQLTVHRDIKGANILVEKSGRIKLADFGMAKTLVEQMSATRSFKGSAFWMAPEVIRQKGHGVAADIWSVGCTVLEMATGEPPWSECSGQVQAIFKIASSQELPVIPNFLSPEASEFILLCLQRDPSLRPVSDQLLMHPFVEGAAAHADVPALQYEQYGDGADGNFEQPARGSSEASSSQRGGDFNDGLSQYDVMHGVHTIQSGMHMLGLENPRPSRVSGGGGGGSLHDEPQPASPMSGRSGRSGRSFGLGVNLEESSNRGHRRTGSNGGLSQQGSTGLLSRQGSAMGHDMLFGGVKVEDWRTEVEAMRAQWSAEEGEEEDGGGGLETADMLDFSAQSTAFRVRGLLELPPLAMPSSISRAAPSGSPTSSKAASE